VIVNKSFLAITILCEEILAPEENINYLIEKDIIILITVLSLVL
jgi:hypothetical protein